MEIHHHSPTARKKWTHYLWEFLMLFLAVFCGFLAENQREHIIEHQREKKYAAQLLADLQNDSGHYRELIDLLDTVIADHKRFTALMTAATKPSNRELLGILVRIDNGYSVYPSKGTYLEMKSSGSLRYIRHSALTSGLKKYYEENLEYLKMLEEISGSIYENLVRPFMIKHFKRTDLDYKTLTVKSEEPVFLNRNLETETELLNIMEDYRRVTSSYQKNAVIVCLKKANELIALLKETYHLSADRRTPSEK